MVEKLARFLKDCYFLGRTPHSASQKFRLLCNLLHPSGKMLGFKISSFDSAALVFLYREIFARQNYYFQASNESPLILDCGANLGMATIYFKWLYPKCRVEAFEPDPATFALLEKNMVQNHLPDIGTHNCALWDRNGEIEFFIEPKSPGSLLMSADHSRAHGTGIHVTCRKLSDFIQGPVDFLKLDVEGAEHRVLRDLVETGKLQFIQKMAIEYHHHVGNTPSCLAEFLKQLEEAGFEYQISASAFPVTVAGVYQDILIGAYRRS